MKRYMNIFNLVWGTFFLCFQLYIHTMFTRDGRVNHPFTLQEYIEHGGTKFDYFFGYMYFTVNDSAMDGIVDLEHSPKDVLVIALTLVWLLGIDVFKNEHRKLKAKSNGFTPLTRVKEKRRVMRDHFFRLVTTCISLYGVYYTVIYSWKFWHL